MQDADARSEEFWHWCLERYDNRELRELLLEAQDAHGFIVLELMLVAWLAGEGVRYDQGTRQAVLSRIGPWYDEVVVPLRRRRQVWRGHQPPTLYESIKRLELRAERELATLLMSALEPWGDGLAFTCQQAFLPLLADPPAKSSAATGCLKRIAQVFDQIS